MNKINKVVASLSVFTLFLLPASLFAYKIDSGQNKLTLSQNAGVTKSLQQYPNIALRVIVGPDRYRGGRYGGRGYRGCRRFCPRVRVCRYGRCWRERRCRVVCDGRGYRGGYGGGRGGRGGGGFRVWW